MKWSSQIIFLTKIILFHEIIESECYFNEILIKKDKVKERFDLNKLLYVRRLLVSCYYMTEFIIKILCDRMYR